MGSGTGITMWCGKVRKHEFLLFSFALTHFLCAPELFFCFVHASAKKARAPTLTCYLWSRLEYATVGVKWRHCGISWLASPCPHPPGNPLGLPPWHSFAQVFSYISHEFLPSYTFLNDPVLCQSPFGFQPGFKLLAVGTISGF